MAEFPEIIEAQLRGATVRVTPLVSFDFKSGMSRLWQGAGTLDAGGQEWQGIGALGSMAPIQSGPRGAVEEIEFSLFGDAGLLDNIEADADESVGRECNVYLQFFDLRKTDEAGNWVDWQPLDNMISMFWGRMGPLSVKRQAASETARGSRVVSVTVQNAMVNRQRPAFGFFSDEDQKARGRAGDDIFIRVPEFSNATAAWPVFGSGVT